MSALDDVRANFNERSVEWLKECLATLDWTSRDLARRIDAKNPFLHKTIERILNRQVKTPHLTTLNCIADILRKEGKITQARTPIGQEELARKWLVHTIPGEIDETDPEPSERTTLWVLGSYTGLSDTEKAIAEYIVRSLPSSLIEAGIRVVVGDSTMLTEFIHNCRDAHNQSGTIAPNPVMIFGRLRKRDLRDLFEDTINCVPDLALLIGGRIERGRVKEEYDCAVKAGIPIICVASTGGVAKQVRSVADKASHLYGILSETGGDVDAGDLTTVIREAVRIYARH